MFAVMLDQDTAALILTALDARPEYSALRDQVWDALIDARNREPANEKTPVGSESYGRPIVPKHQNP